MKIFRQVSDDGNVVRHVGVRDLLAAADACRCANGLTELCDELAGWNVACGKAMSWWNGVAKLHCPAVRQHDFETGECFVLHDRDIVVRINNDRVDADQL